MKELDALRRQVGTVDRRIVADLARRQELVSRIVAIKIAQGLELRDRTQEAAVLSEVIRLGRLHGLDAGYMTRLFHPIIDHSVDIQRELLLRADVDGAATRRAVRVAYQGTDGAYSHLAAMKHFAPVLPRVVFAGLHSFLDVTDAVESGQADYGVLPIENTTAGSINEVYDLLRRVNVSIVGEAVQEVDHCLLVLDEVPLSDLRRVYSHPQALAQCSEFLATLKDCRVESYTDTAMAVEKVRDDGDPTQAAIASEAAGEHFGLRVLRRGLANQPENFTRFVVVAREPRAVDLRTPCKTSLLLATDHREGALARCLNLLATHHLNLTKLESRPQPHTPWEYHFYIDVEGNVADPDTGEALEALRDQTRFLKVLGCYPALAGLSAPQKAGVSKRPATRQGARKSR
jgi:chorismate mutase/prephenate dehydratase